MLTVPTGAEIRARDYWQWIAAHAPTNPRGQCATVTEQMALAFPELRRVRGFYICPVDGRRPHWWMVTPTGDIIDPTVDQFPSCGVGDYEEYTGPEPTGHCLDCGALVFGVDPFCNATCAARAVAFWMNGGRIFVNGRDIGECK